MANENDGSTTAIPDDAITVVPDVVFDQLLAWLDEPVATDEAPALRRAAQRTSRITRL